jgi:hypothetical protein
VTRDQQIRAALDALRVTFADGEQLSDTDSIRLVLETEGPEAVVETILDASALTDTRSAE